MLVSYPETMGKLEAGVIEQLQACTHERGTRLVIPLPDAGICRRTIGVVYPSYVCLSPPPVPPRLNVPLFVGSHFGILLLSGFSSNKGSRSPSTDGQGQGRGEAEGTRSRCRVTSIGCEHWRGPAGRLGVALAGDRCFGCILGHRL